MTFCYIKYSSALGNKVQLSCDPMQNELAYARSPGASKSGINKTRLIRSSAGSTGHGVEVDTMSEQLSGQRSFRLTNQLTLEKSLALIDKYISPARIITDIDGGFTNISMSSYANEDDAGRPAKMHFTRTESTHTREKHSDLPYKYLKSTSSRITRGSSHKKLRISADSNQVLLINPDCCIQLILDYIYDKLGIDKSEITLDLCDEHGNVLEVYQMKPYQNALDKLVNRKTYYLIECDAHAIRVYKGRKLSDANNEVAIPVRRPHSITAHYSPPKKSVSESISRSLMYPRNEDNETTSSQSYKLTSQLVFEKATLLWYNMRNSAKQNEQPNKTILSKHSISQNVTQGNTSFALKGEQQPIEAIKRNKNDMAVNSVDTTEDKASVKTGRSLRPGGRGRNIKLRRKSLAPDEPGSPSDDLTKNSTLMINPDCYVRTLMDYICDQTKVDKYANIDLCDEHGNMMRMFELEAYERASTRLKDRYTYILVAYQFKPSSFEYTLVTPLIYQITITDHEVCSKLKLLTSSRSTIKHI